MILNKAATGNLNTNDQAKPLVRGNSQSIRTAIVGTGYIADFHAYAIRQTPGVELISVCDSNLKSAESFAAQWGISSVFGDLQSMPNSQPLQSVHVLVPPDYHYPLAKIALEAGVSVFLEKPMCTSVKEAVDLSALAQKLGLHLGVSHNFLFSAAYQRLREAVHSGRLGPLQRLTINYYFELPQIRSGPFDSWMLRAPENLMLEVGSHLIAALLDLLGAPETIVTSASRQIRLPGGRQVFRRWTVRANVRDTAVDINIDLGSGFAHRTIYVRGLIGTASADLDANTCVIDRGGGAAADIDRFRRSWSLAQQLRSQGLKTLADYSLSKIGLRHRGNPYQVTILDSVAAFYDGLRSGTALDQRIGSRLGREVVECCSELVRAAGISPQRPPVVRALRASSMQPNVLVFGGTGFIGRELVRQLLAAGFSVRAAVRNSGAILEELDSDALEIVRIDVGSQAALKAAMSGVDFVYHLARAEAKTWEQYLQRDVEPTRQIAQAALAANVKRLIYTGTIDSYYAGAKAGTITEQTPLDIGINRRNYYARAKATSEGILMDMHRTEGLPVVICRPGIVIGSSGTPFHWGVGMWPSVGVCQLWGDGRNKLPLVLVTDVAAALVQSIQVKGIEGRSYNLVDDPLLTAREYLAELEQLAGMALDVRGKTILSFYLTDIAKWVLKLITRHPDRHRIPSYRDWESRTQRALFDCQRARVDLSWKPASDRQRMINEGINASLRGWLQDQ